MRAAIRTLLKDSSTAVTPTTKSRQSWAVTCCVLCAESKHMRRNTAPINPSRVTQRNSFRRTVPRFSKLLVGKEGVTTVLERGKYDQFRIAPLDPSTLRCRDVERTLKQLAQSSDGRLTIEQFAESVESRPIYLAKVGTGPKQILLWSQMHGDEPTHTAV